MRLHVRAYLWYKMFNSLFFGLSVGSIFVLYTPLEPSVFSLGGIALALGLLVVAKFYEKMMHLLVFYRVNLIVELIPLMIIISFLVFKYHYFNALFIYASYQITFMFGGYLVRMETLLLKKTALLSFADVMKQKGYLVGMLLSYGFYKALEYGGIDDKQIQVYDLHLILLLLQIVIVYLLLKAFSQR